jgi:hypothetical protein
MTTVITALAFNQLIQGVYPDITVTTDNKRNYPMTNAAVKVYKNSTQTVLLEIRSITRKLLAVSDQDFYINVINRNTGELLARKLASSLDAANGKLQFTFQPFDLVDMPPGMHSFSISTINSDQVETFLYLDQTGGATGDFEVLDKALPAFSPSILVDNFLDTLIENQHYMVSGMLPADGQLSYSDGLCTLAVYCKNFQGTFYVDGSLANSPGNQDWSPILISESYGNHEFCNFTGCESFQFCSSMMWIRLRYKAHALNRGKLEKVLYRGTLRLRPGIDKPAP